jgi:hypothetical protein
LHKSKVILNNSENELSLEHNLSLNKDLSNKKLTMHQLEINLKKYIKELFDELNKKLDK